MAQSQLARYSEPFFAGVLRTALSGAAVLAPTLLLFTHRLLTGPDGFRIGAFLLPALAETGVVLLVAVFVHQDRLRGTRARFLEYGAHTALGLPATVYLAVGSTVPEMALVRQAVVLALLLFRRHTLFALIQHEFLLVAGIVFLGLRDWENSAGRATILLHIGEQCFVFLGALGARWLLARVVSRGRSILFAAERGRRRRTILEKRLKEVTEALAPESIAGRIARGRGYGVELADRLVITFDCTGAHLAHDHFAKHSPESPRAGVQEFLSEWYRFTAWVAERSRLPGLFLVPGFPFLRLVRPSAIASPDPREELLGAIQLAREVIAFLERSRRTLVGRGREGWIASALIERGMVSAAVGPTEPVWTLRGEAVAAAETFLRALPQTPEHARLWLAPDLFAKVALLFVREDCLDLHGRIGVGLVRAEFSVEGRGLDLAPDFRERLRYGLAGESD